MQHVILRSEGSEAAEATKNLRGVSVIKGSKETLRSLRSLRMTCPGDQPCEQHDWGDFLSEGPSGGKGLSILKDRRITSIRHDKLDRFGRQKPRSQILVVNPGGEGLHNVSRPFKG